MEYYWDISETVILVPFDESELQLTYKMKTIFYF